MAASVPPPKKIRKLKAAGREGSARAGRQKRSASGCIPDTTPVMNVATLPSLWCSSSAPSCQSCASFNPRAPMAMSTKPSAKAASCSPMSARPQLQHIPLIKLKRLTTSRRNPRSSWPITCANPQKAPVRKAEAGLFLARSASGAKAARWSGPESVCRAPAKIPAIAADSVEEIPVGPNMCVYASSLFVTNRKHHNTTATNPVPAAKFR
mmetsp:Transcript_63916/g.116692  ORF Transcript_63916/g.116692 Transcript_63916/m.116692 type:complete len:209 (-) Transcript_63916:683-1309(-)